MPAKINLTNEQIETIKSNYGLMTNTALCKLVKTTPHALTKSVIDLQIEQKTIPKDIYNFDNGNGYFDVEKYLKAIS